MLTKKRNSKKYKSQSIKPHPDSHRDQISNNILVSLKETINFMP